MNIYELDISWAITANERHRLRSELTASEEVGRVFLTARDDTLAVLYKSDRGGFEALVRTLVPGSLETLQ
jgi:hypothetical protein